MQTLHVALRVADRKRSTAFYATLGYEVVGEVPATEHGHLTMLKLPDDDYIALELVHNPELGSVEVGGLSHLAVHVEDAHRTVSRLAAAGVDVAPPTSPDDSDNLWTAWVTDPDGYRIELVQWPPGHPAGMTGEDF